ncbi:MAG: hypothetical protein ACYCW6_01080 [Candidatus Xenobia bacterium]
MTRGDLLMAALLAPLATLLQSTVLYHVLPGGGTLDVVFLVTVGMGVRRGALAGGLAGCMGGLMVGAGAMAGLAWPLSLAYASVGIAAHLFSRGTGRMLFGTVLLAVWLMVLESALLGALHIPHAIRPETAAALALSLGCLEFPVLALLRLAIPA